MPSYKAMLSGDGGIELLMLEAQGLFRCARAVGWLRKKKKKKKEKCTTCSVAKLLHCYRIIARYE